MQASRSSVSARQRSSSDFVQVRPALTVRVEERGRHRRHGGSRPPLQQQQVPEQVAEVELGRAERRVVEIDQADALADHDLLLVQIPVDDRRPPPVAVGQRRQRGADGRSQLRGCARETRLEDLDLAGDGMRPVRARSRPSPSRMPGAERGAGAGTRMPVARRQRARQRLAGHLRQHDEMERLVEQQHLRHDGLARPAGDPADARSDRGCALRRVRLDDRASSRPARAHGRAASWLVLEHLERDGRPEQRPEHCAQLVAVDHSRRAASAAPIMLSVCSGQSGSKLRNGTRARRRIEAARYHSSQRGRRP